MDIAAAWVLGQYQVRRALAVLAAVALCVLPARTRADCLDLPSPALQVMARQIHQNATATLAQINNLLEAARRERPIDPERLASLYALAADANSALELDGPARAAVRRGLIYAPPGNNPLRLNLLVTYAENIYDSAELEQQTRLLGDVEAHQVKGSLGDICTLIGLGWMEHRMNRDDLAMGVLMRAYEASKTGFDFQRQLAAEPLAAVMVSMGDLDQALELNQVNIDWDLRQPADMWLSEARYYRGIILQKMQRWNEALTEFESARALSVSVDDQQGVAFADLRVCETLLEQGRRVDARGRCLAAQATFAAAHAEDMVGQSRVLLARIDLESGDAPRALAALNTLLAHDGNDIMPAWVAPMYELRARANAATGRFEQAYEDLRQSVRRTHAAAEADRVRSGAILRARFRVDRQLELNQSLQQEVELAQERLKRQREELHRRTELMAVGGLVIVLLIYILLVTSRYRQQLQRLANEDGLTRLPNRRRTAQLASNELARASSQHTPLALALIDLDHFKTINDVCGHAAGDQVLKDFGRIAREFLKPGEVLGRWGGEEFVMVLPGLTLDLALARVEALRAAVMNIALPESGRQAELSVSASAGLATNYEGATSLDDIILRADVALYEAKHHGRNVVYIADESVQGASTTIRRLLRRR